jgi:hypothetical protein
VGAATESGGTNVAAEFRFTETQYEPTEDVTSEQLVKLSQDDLLTGLANNIARHVARSPFFLATSACS